MRNRPGSEGEVKAAVITESPHVKEWERYLWGFHFPVRAGFPGFSLFLSPPLSLLINSSLGWMASGVPLSIPGGLELGRYH